MIIISANNINLIKIYQRCSKSGECFLPVVVLRSNLIDRPANLTVVFRRV